MSSPRRTLFSYELRMLLRDRRAIVSAVVLPLALWPLLLWIGNFTREQRAENLAEVTYRYAVSGPHADFARELLAAADALPPPASSLTGAATPPLTLAATSAADPAAELAAQNLHVVVRADLAAGEDPTNASLVQLTLLFRADWDASLVAVQELERRLAAVRQARRGEALAAHGFTLKPDQVMAGEAQDVASASELTGAAIGHFAVLYLVLLLLSGGSVVAADTIAGEKERGTLETLLTTAISRTDIIAAKQLLILSVGVFIAVVQVANLLLYWKFALIPLPADFTIDLSFAQIALLLALLLPLAGLCSGLLLLVSGWAKTYKEFQLWFFPLFVLCALPAAAAVLPGIRLRSAILVVPIANLSVAVKEVLTGKLDFLFLGITVLLSLGLAFGVLRLARQTLTQERLITATEFDRAEHERGPALFQRHVLRWYAVFWAVILLGAVNFGITGVRGQILFNVVGVFLGGSFFLLWRYRLPVRTALSLRPVHPLVWPAVLLGAPAAFLASQPLVRLSAELFPMPAAWLEAFNRALLTQDLATWQLLFWIAIVPGIGEEIAFRGVLLFGLSQRLRPVALALAVGTIFGFCHFDLQRILPVAALGVLLSALTLLTGSIFPAMLWHAANNAIAILAAQAEIEVESLSATTHLAATVVLALALALIWRTRAPSRPSGQLCRQHQ